jgi:hypothetical protein
MKIARTEGKDELSHQEFPKFSLIGNFVLQGMFSKKLSSHGPFVPEQMDSYTDNRG